jgi:hypothetical protein
VEEIESLGGKLPICGKRGWNNIGWCLFSKRESYEKVIISKGWPLYLLLGLKKLSLLVIR